MNQNVRARAAYGAASAPIRTERGTEYAVFAQVTHRLSSVDETDRAAFGKLATAVADNQRLWGVLQDDLMGDANALPEALRAQLLGLAEFVRRHSLQVLAGKASLEALININTSIMRGLRGDAQAAA